MDGSLITLWNETQLNFRGLLPKGNKQASELRVSVIGKEIEFLKSITVLGICIDKNLTFDEHVNDICTKASRQISALQRLTGFIDMPGAGKLFTIASLSPVSIIVPSFGISRATRA